MKPNINLPKWQLALCLILVLNGVSFQSKAQQVLTLTEIRDTIVHKQPVFKMADAAIKAMETEAAGAYAWMPPEFGAGFFQTPYNVSRWKSMNGMPGMGMLMVSAEQMFPNKKAQQAEYDYIKSKGNVEAEKKRGMMNELMSKARDAYYALLLNDRKMDLLAQNKKLIQFMIQSAEIRYKNELGNINSYYKLKASLAKLKIDSQLIRVDEQRQQSIINSLMLRDEAEKWKVDTTIQWRDFGKMMKDSAALFQNAQYKVLQQQIYTNSLQQQAELMALKPQFGVRFEHMAAFGKQPQMFSLMGMLKLPLAKWSAKMNRAKAESLGYENESLRQEQHAYINETSAGLRSKWIEWNGAHEEIALYVQEVIPALDKNFQVTLVSFEQNKAEIIELLDAWQALIDAKKEYLNLLQKALGIQSELMNLFQIVE